MGDLPPDVAELPLQFLLLVLQPELNGALLEEDGGHMAHDRNIPKMAVRREGEDI